MVQAAGAGRFPGLAPGHRQRQLPGQRRRAPPGFGGAGPGRQCANVVFERSAPLWSRRRDEGTSDGRRQAPVRQQALSGRLPGRRHARGERGRDRGEAPPGAAVPPRLGLVPAPGDLGRRRASGDRSPPRADGASRASCGASCRSQAICGSPLPAGSATRRARRTRIRGCAVPWAGSCTATSTRSTAAGRRRLHPIEVAGAISQATASPGPGAGASPPCPRALL